MSAYFDGTARLEVADALGPIAPPFTVMGWIKLDDVTNDHCMWCVVDQSATNTYQSVYVVGSTGGDPLYARTLAAGFSGTAQISGVTAGSWLHIAGVYAATNERHAYLGTSTGSNTANRSPSGLDVMCIGAQHDASDYRYTHGEIAEISVHSVALSADDIAYHASGYSALFTQPESLLLYHSLRDTGSLTVPEIGPTFTNTNAVLQSDHPTITYPAAGALLALALQHGLYALGG